VGADKSGMDANLGGTERAASQFARGTFPYTPRRPNGGERAAQAAMQLQPSSMNPPKPRQLLIRGITKDGGTFRPSDWSERLAGAMACFRPEGAAGGIASFIGYSPLCVPRSVEGVKCVLVSEALRGVEPMAWDFVMNFARDNELEVAEPVQGPQ
jgi:Protein of unknown function (DUF3579)